MEEKIAEAADAGIDFFIFDWYYYDDGPFLHRALEEGFFGARNRGRLKFCTMWANHDWTDIHPITTYDDPPLLYPGKVGRATFEKAAQIHIERYFPRPEYYTVDGAKYFSVYSLHKLIESFGSAEETRRALADFRIAVKAAGFRDLHLNAIIWGNPLLPGEKQQIDPASLAQECGFDSTGSYVWAHHISGEGRQTPWENTCRKYLDAWREIDRTSPLEYFPNLTVGWDASPRVSPFLDWNRGKGYPFGGAMVGRTPEKFEKALLEYLRRARQSRSKHKIITLNSWNEWTEGSYLEPDTRFGNGYLEALKRVLRG